MASNVFVRQSPQTHVSPVESLPAEPAQAAPSSNESPRPFQCTMCGRAFHRLEHQTRHIRTHTGEKPHACTFPGCPKRFSRSDELTRHARTHAQANPRRNGRTSQGHGGQVQHLQAISKDHSSNNSSPNISPPDRGVPLYSYQTSRYEGEFNEMNVLATAASQQLEQERAMPHKGAPLQVISPYKQSTFSLQSSYQSSYFNSGPYNRPILTMSRQHSEDEDDHHARAPDHHRSKRSRPSSPVFSTAPNSPLASHKHSPTPEHTPVVTPAHSPRLHPQELDKLNGIQLPSIRELSLRGAPPRLLALEVDPFLPPKSGYSSPQYGDQPPVNASTLSDILENTSDTCRILPVPRVSISDLVSLNPSPRSGGGNHFGTSSSPRSAPQSRNSSHLNLRDLI